MPSRKNRLNKNKSRRNKHRRGHSRRNRIMYGGMAPLNDSSMMLGQKDNLSQGQQFLEIHKNQHGGMSPYPAGVTDSVLSGSMIPAARTGPLDTAISQIQGMQDGGARRSKRNRNNRNRSNKNKKNKNRSNKNRRNRNHRGGAHMALGGSPLSENSMLLPSGLEKQAALNHDWDAARNPNYWVPK
jgi:hypothetical protein